MAELESRQIVLDKKLSCDCLTELQVEWIFDSDDEESVDWIIDKKFDIGQKVWDVIRL